MSNINFRAAQFLSSAPSLRECPGDIESEVAFAGRSNAGKSSAINALTQNKKLARTSKTPGRTQLINFFSLDGSLQRCLVDLPGYGFAKVPMELKNIWQKHMSEYLQMRPALRGLVVVMDIRHPLQDLDRMLLDWTCEANLPAHLLLTKSDKLTRGAARNTVLKVQRELTDAHIEHLVSAQSFSSETREGMEALQEKIGGWLANAG